MIGCVVVTDGRVDYLARAVASANEHLAGIEDRVIVNDEGSGESHRYLTAEYPDWQVRSHPRRQGLAAAVNTAWEQAAKRGWKYLFHLEEDFTLNGAVDATEIASVLRRCPTLAQVVLKRQAWSPEEVAAGGIVEMHPDDYQERFLGSAFVTFHERIFSLNPCVVPRNVFAQGWPAGNEAEQTKLMLEQGRRFAFWGRKLAAPRVTHIGARRSAAWAL